MKTGSIISYILAAVVIILSFLFILGSGGTEGNPDWLITGIVGMIFGLCLVYAGVRLSKKAKETEASYTLNVDLPGNVQMDTIKCQSCGAPLASDDIKLVNGAVMVQCHSCGTVYQITEEPKW